MRFNLRFLLLLSTGVAILFALLFALPSFWAGAATFVLLGAVPAVLSSGVYFGSGRMRAFCLGALIPVLPNSVICYLINSPAIFVAEEIGWWNSRSASATADTIFLTIQGVWTHLGYAMLAVQVPVWIAACICGGCAVAMHEWMRGGESVKARQSPDDDLQE